MPLLICAVSVPDSNKRARSPQVYIFCEAFWDLVLNTIQLFESYPVIQLEFWSGGCSFAYTTFHLSLVFYACLESMWRFE